MKAVKMILAGGAVVAALVAAAPASAQYYPGNNYGYGAMPYGNNGYGYNGYGGVNSQAAIGQCTNAVQARLGVNTGYGYNGYGNRYGNGNGNGYGGGRVLGISRVEQRSNGGLTVRGVATTGRSAGYGYTPNSPVDLTFKCKTDFRGYVIDIDIQRAQSNYGYNNGYTPYDNNDYSQYGYRRY